MKPLAVFMVLAALALVALMAAAWVYRLFLPGAPNVGGCGFLFVCGSAVAALVGGAIWVWRQEED